MAYYDIALTHIGTLRQLGYSSVYNANDCKSRIIYAADAKSLGNMAKKPLVFFLKSYELDPGAIKAVAQNNGAFAFPLSDFVMGGENRPFSIAKKLGMARLFIKACKKEGARVILCSMAREEFMAPSERELVFFGLLLGMEEAKAKQAISIANIYLEKEKPVQEGTGE
ncbi:MAG: hypothetical protein WC506_06530 [Candidatus Micrarchaeia archaeon]